MQNCFRWETRRGQRKRIRLITHCGIYMDNFQIYGSNKRDLMRAQHMLEAYMRKTLGMHIKSSWRMFRLDYIDQHGKRRGSPVDGMGYVVYRDHTKMRGKIFLRARRKFLKLRKKRLKRKQPSKKLCGSVVAYNGWFENIDSRQWRRRNDYKYRAFYVARKMMGQYMRQEVLYDRQCEIQRAAAAG